MNNTKVLSVIAIILFAIVLYQFFTNKSQTPVDCGKRVKDLADKFGQSNLDSKTARDFFNYLQG